MTGHGKRINEMEIKAAEYVLIADLATDLEVRTTNARLARELRDHLEQLRRELHPCGNEASSDRMPSTSSR